jgi:hypothetical protein
MLIKSLFILWLLGCLNIIYFGFQLGPFLIKNEPEYIFTYPLKAVLLTCIFFSIYFIAQGLPFLLSFNNKHPVLSYLMCSLIVMGQFIPAVLFSMHAPPFWFAYLINTMVLVVFQLLLIPTLFQKKE